MSFALTCRRASETVLDLLWYRLLDLVPLLYTLPQDLVTLLPPAAADPDCECVYDCAITSRRYFTILRAPRPEDFQRFSMYARRIKHFTICGYRTRSDQTYVITRDIWDFLQLHAPKPLLPSLKGLSYTEPKSEEDLLVDRVTPPPVLLRSCEVEEHLQTCDLSLAPFLGPQLKHAFIRMSSQGIRTQASIRTLASLAQELNSLTLGSAWPRTLEGSELAAFVNLSSLSFTYSLDISPNALCCLGTLPQLKELCMKTCESILSEDWRWDQMLLGRPSGLFPTLERLEVTARELEWSIPFMRTIASPSLYSITLKHGRGPRSYTLVEELCEAIVDLPSRDKVTYLSLTTPSAHELDHNFLEPSTVAPLLRLTRLRYLRFEAKLKVIVDDALLDKMSRAWPHLRTLLLVWPKGSTSFMDSWDYSGDWYYPPPHDDPETPQASLPGLIPLIVRCPHLTELALAIDTRRRSRRLQDILDCPPPELRARRSRLRTLTLEGSVLGSRSSLFTVALFFSTLLPCLRVMNSGVPKGWWHRIVAHISDINQIRAEEVRWKARARRRVAAEPEEESSDSSSEE
ncbi:hypothetical protein FKP32DRAFT_1672516 [Trametes sanguinea]|nr:hypothetical protein FKP32DRAFT_1672516 [Trametes sanguinea]